ncbi:MAG: ATP-binding protein [Gammaproteobacteria bacterium]|nr:ATP-binding protein [Gammaproteobacteria bacterium]
MQKRKLPIGIQTFRKIREDDYYYVDKSAYLTQLNDEGTHFFLSRPRRFGKSLFLDTLEELFEGSEELFRGLAIHGDWDWSVRHPVVRLSFGGGNYTEPGQLHASLMAQLDAVQRRTGAASDCATAPERFARVLEELHQQSGRRVVVLVDEYDRPILDALDSPEVARDNRDFLRGFYSVVKDADSHVRFVFLTGVSRFSKVSLFSGLNNLADITLDARYSAICGFTDADLDDVFAAELPGLDRARIREWYSGYAWLGEEKVYNPYDVLPLFLNRRFDAYWFETGTPRFLVDTLFERRVTTMALAEMVGGVELLSAFDVGQIGTEALLFQTGYLTVRSVDDAIGERLFRLGYPNREVRQSLNRALLGNLVKDVGRELRNSVRLTELLAANDFDGMRDLFEAFYASIPYQWYTNNDIADYEGYYASVFYSYFAALGLDIVVEDSSSHGRLDMAVRANGNVYLFEFKVAEQSPPGSALKQLEEKDYAAKYRASGEPIHLVGVEFSSAARNVTAFEVAHA